MTNTIDIDAIMFEMEPFKDEQIMSEYMYIGDMRGVNDNEAKKQKFVIASMRFLIHYAIYCKSNHPLKLFGEHIGWGLWMENKRYIIYDKLITNELTPETREEVHTLITDRLLGWFGSYFSYDQLYYNANTDEEYDSVEESEAKLAEEIAEMTIQQFELYHSKHEYTLK
jgi:hypothetical protein